MVNYKNIFIINGSYFSNNAADLNGGSIYLKNSGNITIIKTIFSNNNADFGGSIYYEESIKG